MSFTNNFIRLPMQQYLYNLDFRLKETYPLLNFFLQKRKKKSCIGSSFIMIHNTNYRLGKKLHKKM